MDKQELKDLLVRRAQAYQVLLDTESGKLVMEDLATVCHVNRTTFVVGDPPYTSFNEGKRWVYLYMQERLKAAQSPETLAATIDEMLEQEEDDD